MLKKKENERGITLLALIITVIVLLILAGITIVAISGENRNYKESCGSERGNRRG